VRVGEILLEHNWVDEWALARALRDQPRLGERLCSILVERGQLDPDHAALALAEQHEVAAVLQRHLDNRDPALAKLLPPAIARAHVALPIGRLPNGDLVVCARDPSPEATRAIANAIGSPVVIAVAAACQLEQLVDGTYRDAAPAPEPITDGVVEGGIDIDMNTGPITMPHDQSVARPSGRATEIPYNDLGALTLVELDDHRVARDPTQTDPLIGRRANVSSLPPLTKKSRG
jgi:type II secretion system (T2SS) protein E